MSEHQDDRGWWLLNAATLEQLALWGKSGKPYPGNPRVHSDAELDLLAEAMRRPGVKMPC
jgi:hypothetical protein